VQPCPGDGPVRRLREVDAVPVHRRGRVRARRRAGEAAGRDGVVVVLAARAAACHQRRAAVKPCVVVIGFQLDHQFIRSVPMLKQQGSYVIDLTENGRPVQEGEDGGVVVGERDLCVRVLLLERLDLAPEEVVVVARQAVVLGEAPVAVVVCLVGARVERQHDGGAARRQDPRHHDAPGAEQDQPLHAPPFSLVNIDYEC
jgi:hypothetical protein